MGSENGYDHTRRRGGKYRGDVQFFEPDRPRMTLLRTNHLVEFLCAAILSIGGSASIADESGSPPSAPRDADAAVAFFEAEIRPVLATM